MKNDKTKIDINTFSLINSVDELPPELKREVMATINYAHLMADLGQLFSLDMARTAGKMIDPGSDQE